MLHTLAIGSLVYFALILALRVSGKRTLSKWNAFDSIVTFALGSIVASATLSPTTSIAQGVVAVGLFVSLQFAMTWMAVRFPVVRRLIKAEPVFLVHEGRILDAALERERVTRGELLAAVRGKGLVSVSEVHAVVLETSGTFSVMATSNCADRSALADVHHVKTRPGAERTQH
ncbi:MAG: DUF421 domain-containing protein [Pseudomonadota bacterium]|nr:DUF421 domain-containing protein [Pseudomonadota bacterium]